MELTSSEDLQLTSLWEKENKYFAKFKNISVPMGGLTFTDCITLYSLINTHYTKINNNPTNIRIADVGCWTGISSLVLALIAQKFTGTVYSIDWFRGSENTNLDFAGKYFNIKQIFLDNINSYETKKHITLIEGTSTETSTRIANESLDVVFLDADHRYRYIKKDIETWLPKLKRGGLMCGHDCEMILDKGLDTIYEITNDLDIIEVIHMGVCRAVTNLGGKKAIPLGRFTAKESLSCGMWYYEKQ